MSVELHLRDFLSPGAAFLSAMLAVWGVSRTIKNNRNNQDSKIAHDAYEGYVKDAISYPGHASGIVDIPEVPAGNSVDELYQTGRLPDDFVKYEWIVARMLSACERVLAVTPGDLDWENTIRAQLRLHHRYFNSDFFGEEEYQMYSSHLRRLIGDVVGADSSRGLGA